MAIAQTAGTTSHIRTLFQIGTIGGLSDRDLLEQFAAHAGEQAELAFATLVERHGPMVHRVCRSILQDANDVDDAFQASFLVLAHRTARFTFMTRFAPGSIKSPAGPRLAPLGRRADGATNWCTLTPCQDSHT